VKVVTHLIFAECCWFATSAVFDVHYETPAVLAAAATAVLPDADHPGSWLGRQLGGVSEVLNRLFGYRGFLTACSRSRSSRWRSACRCGGSPVAPPP
jgi:LexA-binding, inner membrane-associated putative hydrolase